MREAAAGRLAVTVERGDGFVVVRAEGEVDLGNADRFAAALREGAGDTGLVVVDLIGVPFMDSSGLKALLLASVQLGDRLALALGPGSPVAHLIEIAEVGDRFSIHPSAEDAIRARAGG